MRYSTFGHWISRTWLAFMDESQQYGNYHEIAALAAIQQPMLTVFIGDHRQTPGGLSKGRAAAVNRPRPLKQLDSVVLTAGASFSLTAHEFQC